MSQHDPQLVQQEAEALAFARQLPEVRELVAAAQEMLDWYSHADVRRSRGIDEINIRDKQANATFRMCQARAPFVSATEEDR